MFKKIVLMNSFLESFKVISLFSFQGSLFSQKATTHIIYHTIIFIVNTFDEKENGERGI